MILKIFKSAWFLSLGGFMAIFFYIYASLPETVLLGKWTSTLYTSRNVVFYATLSIIALINMMVFAFMKAFGSDKQQLSVWFFGQIILLNFFFSTVLGFINLLNSREKFAYEHPGIVIYGIVILVILWAVSWPVYSLSRKIFSKSAV